MTFLLDTCALLWWWGEPDALSPRVLALLKGPKNGFFVSSATAWEIATKFRIGKLPLAGPVVADWQRRMVLDRFVELPITAADALRAGGLSSDHKDPFDRMIASQAMARNLPVVTSDVRLAELGAEVVW